MFHILLLICPSRCHLGCTLPCMLASLDVQSLAVGASLPPLVWVAFKAFTALQSAVRPDASPHNYKALTFPHAPNRIKVQSAHRG